jgi:hypothetical protein
MISSCLSLFVRAVKGLCSSHLRERFVVMLGIVAVNGHNTTESV